MPKSGTNAKTKYVLGRLAQEIPHGYKENANAMEKFMRLCELADILDSEFCVSEIQINVESIGKCGTICVDTDEVVFEYGRSHKFFEYVKFADFLSFSKTKSGMLRIAFGVRDLWVIA